MTLEETRRDIVIRKLIKKEITLNHAVQELELSRRHVLRLKAGVKNEGSCYLIHGNKTRKPAHAIDEETRRKVVDIVNDKYKGHSYHKIRQLLEDDEGISLSVSSVVRILGSAGIKGALDRKDTDQRKKTDYQSAEKGLLYLGHKVRDWFCETGTDVCLLIALDVATGKILDISFSEKDKETGYAAILKRVIKKNGIPAKIYYEDNSLVYSSGKLTLEDELAGRRLHLTRFGEILEAFGIKFDNGIHQDIKNKVNAVWENFNDTACYELKLKNIRDCRRANLYSKRLVGKYNENDTDEGPIEGYSDIPAEIKMEEVFNNKRVLTVSDDSKIIYKGRTFMVKTKKGEKAGIRSGKKVSLQDWVYGKGRVLYNGAIYMLDEVYTDSRM